MMTIHVEERLDIPLCVDLDGTLVHSDTLWESLLILIKDKPLMIFAIMLWIIKGRAYFKAEVAKRVTLNPNDLAYNDTVVAFVRDAYDKGRNTVLVTGAHRDVANAVASHLGIFKNIMASNQTVNNTGTAKRDALLAAYGENNFDYMGNSRADIPSFDVSSKVTVVSPDRAAARWHKNNTSDLMEGPSENLKVMIKAIRPHQWLKNVLVAVPLILTHEISNLALWLAVVIAFYSFSFMAGAVYLLNDMLDLASDRAHPRKCKRPLASGQLSIPHALVMIAVLSATAIALALFVSVDFFVILLGYAVMTTLYSFWLKKKLLIDVFTLAGLFTTRIIAGTIAVGTTHSYWLLAFSLFFFLSLAMVKRYSELLKEQVENVSTTAGRGYMQIDFEMIGQAGISSSFSASLVLALYIDYQSSLGNYASPYLLWPLCPIILFLLLRIWILARRGFMEDDPLVFLLQDWRSQCICVIGGLFVLLAAMGI
ncbi:MAG: UbiA family prenyltransferase [Hyphomicrobiales bacterium]